MKNYKVEDIRNVGLVGHGHAGKTSVSEAILFNTGASDRLGKVGDSTSMMDYDPDEIKRGHSINASLAFAEAGKNKINLVDTPGNNNFIADTPACIRVVDGVVVVVGADDGVQYFTERVWNWADEEGLPRIVFINKADSERANIAGILESLRKKFGVTPVLLSRPIGSGENLKGLVDLAELKAYTYEGGKGQGAAGPVPGDLKDEVETARAELTEAVAEVDDELIEHYLDKGELSDEEFAQGLRNGIESGKLVPVLCGSATLNIGIDRLQEAMISYLPSPDRRKPFTGMSGDKEVPLPGGADQGLAALVFKTVADPYAGKLTLFRVFSGVLKADSSVYNPLKESAERVGQVYLIQGKKQVSVQEVAAGDLGAVAKLRVTTTGDTLSAQNAPVVLPPINFPKPVLSRAVLPKTRADEEKISSSLARMAEEDPTLTITRDPETHEQLMSGMGEVHLDVIIERMKRRFGVEVDVKPPKVPYRETIRGRTKVQGKYKKQTGGRGQYGDTWIEISPLEKGGGFLFEDKIVGGAIPKTYIPAVEKGIQEAMAQGVIAHYPMVDVKVSLYDGSYHDVDSSEMAFKIAGSLGFKKGVMDCRPTLLEPVMAMEVVVPSEYVGDIMGDLNSKRGRIQGIDAGGDTQSIKAQVPMAEVLNYAADLRSMTSGRGNFVMEFDHYDDVPDHLAQKIIAEANRQHEEGRE